LIAFDVRHYGSVGSTNDEALRLARGGAPQGTVVCAREQTAGRGRQRRLWHSPPGNLYVSILLRLDLPPARAAELSFVTALAVADAVDAFLPNGTRAELKWPNDVLVAGAKISGILLEHVGTITVIGIGLNVQHAPSDTPYPATSLMASGAGTATPESVLPVLLDAFARRLADWQAKGFAATRAAWLERAPARGSPIGVTIGDRSISGRFADLAPDGALIVDTNEGLQRFVAGDVHLSLRAKRSNPQPECAPTPGIASPPASAGACPGAQ